MTIGIPEAEVAHPVGPILRRPLRFQTAFEQSGIRAIHITDGYNKLSLARTPAFMFTQVKRQRSPAH